MAEGLTGHAAAVRVRVEPAERECEEIMTSVDVSRLIRSDVAGMEEYAPIVPFEVLSARLGFAPEDLVKLDANENPYGPSPRAIEAMCRFPFHHVYPDPDQAVLRAGLEKYTGVDRSHILCGNGSDEIIDVILRLFIEPGDAIVNCPPTFGMYSFLAQICSARQIEIARRADFSLDLEAIEAQFAAESDGPHQAGLRLPAEQPGRQPHAPGGAGAVAAAAGGDRRRRGICGVQRRVDRRLGAALLEPDRAADLQQVGRPGRVCVWATACFRTISSSTCGRSKQPYNLNVAAQAAALASIEDVEYLRGNVRRIVAERERLTGLLGAVPYLHPYPSRSNFILCRVRGS